MYTEGIMNDKSKIRITVYINADQHEKLRKVQEKVGVPMAEQIRRALDLWLKQQAK